MSEFVVVVGLQQHMGFHIYLVVVCMENFNIGF
jgi:hypothetical protein